MMNHLNEETIMEVIADIMTKGLIQDFDTEDQMVIIELVTASIKSYYTKELDKFLEDLHLDYYKGKKEKLSDL